MSAPTAGEIAEARRFYTGPARFVMPPTCLSTARTLLAALDAADAERKDAVGALDDAGVRCNPADDLATRVEKLAKDRDEIARLWTGVLDLFWPHRQPDDGFGVDDVREAVEEREQRGDAAEARAALKPFANIEVPVGANDGTWVATTLHCGDQVTAHSVWAARAALGLGKEAPR